MASTSWLGFLLLCHGAMDLWLGSFAYWERFAAITMTAVWVHMVMSDLMSSSACLFWAIVYTAYNGVIISSGAVAGSSTLAIRYGMAVLPICHGIAILFCGTDGFFRLTKKKRP